MTQNEKDLLPKIKKLALKGHSTRGKEVIELLKMLGGVNIHNLYGDENYAYYTIDSDREINYIFGDEYLRTFTLEDFLEKYPYKVGDKVIYTKFGDNCDDYPVTIESMEWTGTTIEYTFDGCVTCLAKDLKMWNGEPDAVISGIYLNSCDYADEVELNLGDYEIEVRDGKTYAVKKNTKYPTTHVEYCEALGYKVDDIIFIKDTGWIRITNKLWDCYAEEHVYEGIGIINEHEYKDIRHHNVTGKIQLGLSKHCNDVDDVRYVNSITGDIMINQITNKVSVIKFNPDVCDNKIELHLGDYEIEVQDGKTYAVKKKPKYPSTYLECCSILKINNCFSLIYDNIDNKYISDYEYQLMLDMDKLRKLIICRNAYWKIAGEQMGLNKPWEPDWTTFEGMPAIFRFRYNIVCDFIKDYHCLLVFPTEEMRDAFFDNFKDLVEQCKELL